MCTDKTWAKMSSSRTPNDSNDGGSVSQPPTDGSTNLSTDGSTDGSANLSTDGSTNWSTDGSTNWSTLPMPDTGVFAVWSPKEQQKYANEQSAMEEELVVKSTPPAELERCDNRGVSKKEVLKAIDDYVKCAASELKRQELEDELTYVNADVKKVRAEPDGSYVLDDIYVKYSTFLTDYPFE